MRLFLIVALLFTVGCGHSATITKRNGQEIEGKISHSSESYLYVETEYEWDRHTESVSRSSIAEVDHPGNAVAAVGFSLIAYGIVNVAVAGGGCQENGAAYCAGVFSPLAVGIPLAIWGYTTWAGSKERAKRIMEWNRF